MARIKEPQPEPSVGDLERQLAALLVDVADATDESARAALSAQIDEVEEQLTRRRIDEERAARRQKLIATERARRERAEAIAAQEAELHRYHDTYLDATKAIVDLDPKLDELLDALCNVIAQRCEAGSGQWQAIRRVRTGDESGYLQSLEDTQMLQRYVQGRLAQAFPGVINSFDANVGIIFANGRQRTWSEIDAWTTQPVPYEEGALLQDYEAEQAARAILGVGPDDPVQFHSSDDLEPEQWTEVGGEPYGLFAGGRALVHADHLTATP